MKTIPYYLPTDPETTQLIILARRGIEEHKRKAAESRLRVVPQPITQSVRKLCADLSSEEYY